MPSTPQVLASQALENGAPLSTLCRYRHNVDYADTVIMPISRRSSLVGGVAGLVKSA
jgi:hypothetical protein